MNRWRAVRLTSAAVLLVTQFLPHEQASAQPRVADSSVQASTTRPVSSRDIIEAARVTGVRMAPDGDRVAYEVSRADVASNSRAIELWIANTADDRSAESATRLLTRTRVGGAPPAFDAQFVPGTAHASLSIIATAPDRQGIAETALIRRAPGGDSIAPLRASKAASTHLLLSAARFPSDSAIIAHRWSPDGRWLAIIVSSPPPSSHPPTRLVEKRPPPGPSGFDVENLRWPYEPSTQIRRLWLFERATQGLEPLTDGRLDVESVAWSPDGQRLAIAAAEPGHGQPVSYTDLYLLTLAGRAITPLVRQPGWDQEPAWSHDGQHLAFISQRGRLDWTYASTVGIVSIPESASIAPPASSSPIYIGDALDEQIGSTPAQPWWSADDSVVFVSAGYHMGRHLFAVDVRTGQIAQRTSNDAYFAHVSASSDGRTVALSVANATTPAALHVATTTALPATHLVATATPRWGQNLQLPRVERIEWPSEDERFVIPGVLLLPPDFRADAAYPVIVFAAGGPSMIRLGFNLDEDVFPHLAWAASGYVVFVPNTRGRRGYGRAFREAPVVRGHLFEGPTDDIARGLDLLRARGILRDDRVGIAGFSYGGSLATFAITRSDRYKAAIIHEGRPNYLRMVTSLGGRDEDLQLLRDQQGLAPVWDDGSLERLIAHSPILSMQRVVTPTLLIYGEDSAARTDGIDLLRALRHFRVPSRLRVYSKTGHVIQAPALLLDSFDQAIEWCDRWLKPIAVNRPVPAPANH